jgi:type I restriction enzyme M protein
MQPTSPARKMLFTYRSLDLFWLKDKGLTDLDNLPEPDTLAVEIIENLQAGLASFRAVLKGLRKVG